jgi:hypothetical protein
MSIESQMLRVRDLLENIEKSLAEKGTYLLEENPDELIVTIPKRYKGKNLVILYLDK